MKKKLKRILSALLVAVMLVGIAPMGGNIKASALNSSGQCGENVYYTFDESTGLLTVSGEGEMWGRRFDGNSEIKTVVVEDGVTSIGNGTFYCCTGLTSITIPDSVTSIGSLAFYCCTGLTSITIPDSVTSIGNSAFYCCTGLTSVTVDSNNKKYDSRNNCNAIIETESNTLITGCKNTIIPDGVTSIGDTAFYYCTGLTSITIPDSVTSIGSGAFEGCTGLTSITIPDSVTSIGDTAFYKCTGLTSITIPDSVTSIGVSAFYGCTGLTSITIGDSVTSIGDLAFCGCTGLTSITIPDSVTSIGRGAFEYCRGLTSITIPDSVTSIDDEAFYKCTGLTSVTIGKGVTSIGDLAFSGCTGLTSINVDSNNKIYDSRNNCNAIIETESNTLIYGCKSTVIPDSVTSIGDAFYGCTGLRSITIPDSVTSIGRSAFVRCTGLTSITIGDNVTSIGDSAFYKCTGLTSITIPDNVKSIGWSAFDGCTGLTSITIPDSVTHIGDYAFYYCSSLTSIAIPDSVTSIGDSAFSGCDALADVYYSGSESEWNEISIDSGNMCLTNATIHYTNHYEQNTSPSGGKYKIILNAGSGKFGDGTNQKIYYFNEGDDLIGFTSFVETPSKSGLKFNVWCEDYGANVFYILPFSMPANDIVLLATWTVEGVFQDYTTAVVPNGNKTCVSDVTIDGKSYSLSGDYSLSFSEADNLVGSKVTAFFKNDKICFIEKYQKPIPHSSTYKTTYTEYGQVKYETEEEYKVLESANNFVEKMNEYFNSFGAYLGDAKVIDYKQLAKDLKKNDPGYFGVADISSGAEDALYYALAKFIVEVSDNNKLYLKIKPSASVTQNAINITNSINNSINYEQFECYYNDYEISFNVLTFNSAFTGDFSVVKDKGKNSEEKYTGAINSSIDRTQRAMTDYLNNLGDLVEDECKMAICSLYNEFMNLTGLAQAKDEALNRFFGNISEKFVKKFGDVYKAFIAIKTGYNVLSKLRAFNDINLFLAYNDNATNIYNTIKNLDFSEKGIKDRATKKAISALEAARKDLLDRLYNYIYHSNSGDPDNRSFVEKTGDWLKGAWNKVMVACPVEFEIYDENNNLIGYVDSSSAHDEYIYFNNDILIEVKDDVKYIYYPSDMKISIKMTAYEDGKMDFSIEQFMDGTATGKVVYNDIPLSNEESYNQVLSKNMNLQSMASEDSTISSEFNTEGTYYDVKDSNANIRVNCVASDGGKVIYYEQSPIGTVVNIYALPEEGYRFDGWICDDVCVSKDSCYSFVAKNNVSFVAKFSKITSEHSHSFSDSWKSDSNNHWKECSCGEKADVATHVEGEWKITQPATVSSAGTKVLCCSICGAVIRTEVIPKLDPPNGNIKSVSINDISLNYKKSATIKPTIKADEGAKYTVKYSSSNTKVATVDENGKVYAAKRGSATITCTVTDSNGNTVHDTCKVTVKYSFGQWLIKILLFGWIWY